MFLNNLKISLRKLFSAKGGRSTGYSWINVGGLTIGLLAFLLIGHYVNYELGYDRFFPGYQNLYRLNVERIESGEKTMQSAKTYAGIGNLIKAEIPEVVDKVRILHEECMFHYEPDDIKFNRQNTFWADGNIINFFGLDMIATGQTELMYQPNHAIISASAASRFFGADWAADNRPIGETLILNGGVPFMIQGVYRDIPVNSHFQADFIVSYSTLMALLGDFMNTVMPPQQNFVYTYLSMKEHDDLRVIEEKINRVATRNTGTVADHVSYHFFLQPVSSIHLNSHLSDELEANGNRLFILALSLAALMIVIIAWINFLNLSVAKIMSRAREAGVRKALGAGKRQLVVQFTLEILIQGMMAVFLTCILLLTGSGYFEQAMGIPFSVFAVDSWKLWLVFSMVFLAGGILTAFYPSMLLSSVDPQRAIKGKTVFSYGKNYLRKGLILFQFFVSMFLIACTGAIYHQVESMRRQSLAHLQPEQVFVVHSPRTMIGHPDRARFFKQFRQDLESITGIESVASGGCLPGENFLFHDDHVHAEGRETEINWSFDIASVDERYLPALGIRMIEGRNFENAAGEENKVMLNETAVKVLGFKSTADAVGKFVRINQEERYHVVGVMEDTHFRGLRESIKPIVFHYGHDYEFGFFPIRIGTHNLQEVIEKIQSSWEKVYPRDPFEYFFLDRFFDRQYSDDKAFGKLFGSFSLLAVLISGLGLFGLISFVTNQRSKEIGIRKVMGANVFSIIGLLTMDTLKLLLLAAFISLPLAYLIIGNWLDTFAYRFEPPVWMFALPLILLMITSLIAVGSQTLRSALSNPVDAIAEND